MKINASKPLHEPQRLVSGETSEGVRPVFSVSYKRKIICPLVEDLKIKNNGLTDEEISEGYFMDVVLGKCNIKKALQQRSEAIRSEYEAFDSIHRNDGVVGVSNSPSKL